ncbi:MAG TPA: Rieske (2Fe-2S) protein [Magnetospirillaceae bacterium]|nr:Rieske (2Fe-2S) protein [Magnetospirillaceae bacterium]
MSETERLTSTPVGVALGALDIVADGKARGFVIEMQAGRFYGFVVRQGETVRGYVDRCPHMGFQLVQRLDDYLTPSGEMIACAWHSALFDIADGRCLGGPCRGQRLIPWPVAVIDGRIVTA